MEVGWTEGVGEDRVWKWGGQGKEEGVGKTVRTE